jgi:preprotein translocase subunit SecD
MKKKNLLQRAIIIAVVTVLGLYVVIGPRHRPTAHDFTPSGLKDTLRSNIRLGLDLKGGVHLVMRVKTEELFEKLTKDNAVAIEKAAKEKGFVAKKVSAVTNPNNYQVIFEATDGSKLNDIQDAVKNSFVLNDWNASTSGNTITWTLTSTAQRALGDQATDQAKTIIDSRLNAMAVAEPLVQDHGARGSHEILVQMPGIQDPEHVKQILRSDSKLELVHVVSPPSPNLKTYESEQEATLSLGPTVPPNRRVLPYAEREPATASDNPGDEKTQKQKKWVVIESPGIIEGGDLRNASATQSRAGADEYQIQFSLKPDGAKKFGAWTGANINEYMGVVLENEVKSIAFIKSQITDQGEIEGKFTKQSADDLALTLRSGALPASIAYQEERTVGPSLGADSIRSGVRASLVGLILVVAFMLFYYRGSGINAVVALLLNMILMLAGLILFGATLTLPGIAGIILTIGMAVDSNVLIFERIREEWRSGKTIQSSVDTGFARAFVTIIDTHVTTIVSSLFLFVFGTGPIRGFAVTLVLGLLINLFSAVFVSRTIFVWLLSRKDRVESLSI